MNPRRRALVTGAARRVGAVIADTLHPDYDLLLHARHSHDAACARAAAFNAVRDGSARVVAGELGDEAARATLDEAIGPEPLHLAVFNASRFGRSDLAAAPPARNAELRAFLEVNLVATWDLALRLRTRLVAAARETGDASLVVILDIYAQRPLPGYEAYSISRAAGVMLVQSLARAFGSEGIRVNGVAPGTVLWADGDDRAETETLLAQGTALGHIGSPADVAGAVRYLAGAQYVTGAILPVDGGRGTRI